MKKLIVFLIIAALAVMVAGCGGKPDPAASPSDAMAALMGGFSSVDPGVDVSELIVYSGAEGSDYKFDDFLMINYFQNGEKVYSVVLFNEYAQIFYENGMPAVEAGIYKVSGGAGARANKDEVIAMCRARIQKVQFYLQNYASDFVGYCRTSEVEEYGDFIFYTVCADNEKAMKLIRDALSVR